MVGTGALAHSQQTSANLRLAYDVSPLVQATYSLGVWNNHQVSDPQTYLRSTATGAPTFAGISGFASGKDVDATRKQAILGLRNHVCHVHRPSLVCRHSRIARGRCGCPSK